jgi:hypothetical protein
MILLAWLSGRTCRARRAGHRQSRVVVEALTRGPGGMFARWSAGLQRAGMPAPLLDYGLGVQRLDPTIAPERLAE